MAVCWGIDDLLLPQITWLGLGCLVCRGRSLTIIVLILVLGEEGCVDLVLACAQQELLLVQAYICGKNLMLLKFKIILILADEA